MDFEIREMQPDDIESLQEIYQRFTMLYSGPLARKPTFFKRNARKKDGLCWVALDIKGNVVGYILSAYKKGKKLGVINEIVVDPKHDFAAVANPLADRICSIFLEKGAASIQASTIRNPHYAEIFGRLGFLRVETDSVFMVTVHDVPRFLVELSPVFTGRLRKLQDWDGWVHLCCEQNSRFFRKDGENVQQHVRANQEADLKISLEVQTLVDLLLGVLPLHRASDEKRILVEATLHKDKVEELLKTIFPETHFLAFNFW